MSDSPGPGPGPAPAIQDIMLYYNFFPTTFNISKENILNVDSGNNDDNHAVIPYEIDSKNNSSVLKLNDHNYFPSKLHVINVTNDNADHTQIDYLIIIETDNKSINGILKRLYFVFKLANSGANISNKLFDFLISNLSSTTIIPTEFNLNLILTNTGIMPNSGTDITINEKSNTTTVIFNKIINTDVTRPFRSKLNISAVNQVGFADINMENKAHPYAIYNLKLFTTDFKQKLTCQRSSDMGSDKQVTGTVNPLTGKRISDEPNITAIVIQLLFGFIILTLTYIYFDKLICYLFIYPLPGQYRTIVVTYWIIFICMIVSMFIRQSVASDDFTYLGWAVELVIICILGRFKYYDLKKKDGSFTCDKMLYNSITNNNESYLKFFWPSTTTTMNVLHLLTIVGIIAFYITYMVLTQEPGMWGMGVAAIVLLFISGILRHFDKSASNT